MSKIDRIIHEIHFLDDAPKRGMFLCRIHPLVKVIVTIWYMVLVMSFSKYELTGLAGMCLYPVCLMILDEVPVKRIFSRLKMVLLLVCAVGIANPFLDREPVIRVGVFLITGGMLSLATLVMKAVFALLASYLLIVSTSIEQICCALRMLHMPKVLVVLVMLIYRYLILMLKEAQRLTQAYAMRAPNQRGIHYKAWGTLTGQMLLRSMDRAGIVYESMQLRGFCGEFYPKGQKNMSAGSIAYLILVCLILLVLRMIPVFEIAGSLFAG